MDASVDDTAQRWYQCLLTGSREVLEGTLLQARARLGGWYHVADELSVGLRALGEAWRSGRITVAAEHMASERLGRAVNRLIDALPVPPQDHPLCVLACPPSDEHVLGLRLAELCLREASWRTTWLGARMPIDELMDVLAAQRPRLLALSAMVAPEGADPLANVVLRLQPTCTKYGIALVLGGGAPWPDPPPYGQRLHSFYSFHQRVKQLSSPASPSNSPKES